MSGEESGPGLDATLHEFTTGQKLFNRYTLIKTLGRGGMGVVWLARDDELERDVALKFLPDLIVRDRAVLSDMKRETRRSLELTHKNIVRIHDFIYDERSGCISMEYIDGDTLSNLRVDKPRKVFEPVELAGWTSQLCDALDYAHNYARIIHRDLKPSNLMVTRRGDLKIADFGIARSLNESVSALTLQRGRSGTLLYMSPQQLDGERGSHLDDVYSVGATLYELITSKPPFYFGNIDRQVREKTPPRMAVRRQELEIEGEPILPVWDNVVRACLEKDPARRPQSVNEIAERLALASPKTATTGRSVPKQRKSPFLIVAIFAVLFALAGFAVWHFGLFPKLDKSRTIVTPQPPVSESQAPSAPTVAKKTTPAPASTAATTTTTALTTPSTAALSIAEKLLKEATGLRDKDDTTNALARLQDAAQRDPKNANVLAEMAMIYETIQLYDRSNETWKKIMEIGPSAGPLYELADMKLKTGVTPPAPTTTTTTTQPTPTIEDPRPTPAPKPSIVKLPVTDGSTYEGTIRIKNESSTTVPVLIKIGSDLKSGTMTQSGHRGDVIVRFTGVWDGVVLHAVTDQVVSAPKGINWRPESFTLRFTDDGKSASYECVADGKTYTADLSIQTSLVANTRSAYRGTIRAQGDTGAGTPLRIDLSADRKSGTMTQTSKAGDIIVKFNGFWDGNVLRAVTNDVVSKPKNIQWKPESFTLRISDYGWHASYECNSEGRIYTAELATP